jgi:hypothetical protein
MRAKLWTWQQHISKTISSNFHVFDEVVGIGRGKKEYSPEKVTKFRNSA